MDRKVKSFRLRVDLLNWIESYAESRGSSQIAVLESALDSFRADTRGGVPDLPVAEPVAKRAPKAKAPAVQTRDELNLIRQRALNERRYAS